MMIGNLIDHPVFRRDGRAVEFRPETLEKVGNLIGRYPEGYQKSALIPILHIAQEELGGSLTVDIMDYVAGLLNIQPVEVYEVATFYSMFYLEKTGKYVLEVCRTGPCSIAGGDKIKSHLCEILGINPGETTPDGMFTVKEVECLGSCGTAPVMQVNTQFYENLTASRVDRLLNDLRENAGNDQSPDSTWAGQFS